MQQVWTSCWLRCLRMSRRESMAFTPWPQRMSRLISWSSCLRHGNGPMNSADFEASAGLAVRNRQKVFEAMDGCALPFSCAREESHPAQKTPSSCDHSLASGPVPTLSGPGGGPLHCAFGRLELVRQLSKFNQPSVVGSCDSQVACRPAECQHFLGSGGWRSMPSASQTEDRPGWQGG